MNLHERIKKSGFRQNFIADKLGLSKSHFNQMIKGTATMPERIRNRLNKLLSKVEA